MTTPTICPHGVTVDESTSCRACLWERENPDKVTQTTQRIPHAAGPWTRQGAQVTVKTDPERWGRNHFSWTTIETSDLKPGEREDYARLAVASANSYMKHCLNPVEAAEEDLLGECITAIRDFMAELNSNSPNVLVSRFEDILSKTTRNRTE